MDRWFADGGPRSMATLALVAIAGSTVTSNSPVCANAQDLWQGDPLHVRTEVASAGRSRCPGTLLATFSLIEHSVIITTCAGLPCSHSRSLPRSSGKIGRRQGLPAGIRDARVHMPGFASRKPRTSSALKRSCTSQWPCHVMILTLVCFATYSARNSSGIITTVSTPHSSAMLSTTATAVGRGAADIALGLHFRGSVHIGDDRKIPIAIP